MDKSKAVNYRRPSLGRTLNQNKTLILMCVPAIMFFFVFSYMPMPGAYIAFTNFQYNKGIFGSPFIGLQNFKFLFMSGQLTLLLRNTILYNLAFIILGNVLQLAFAILLNEVQSKAYKKTTQSMMFLPYFISDVLVSLLVYNLLNYDFGFISNLVRSLGGEMPKVYQMPNAWPIIIVLVNLWKG
ncbi:MAG: sugar ABC transporter permease, partial [Clostridia bacterium]|nr:sugar ABC transporter permease [Clostridia bacterium]